MKKIFTLLVSIGTLTSVFAQQGQRDSHQQPGKYEQPSYPSHDTRDVTPGKTVDYNNNNSHPQNFYSFTSRERDAQIQRINREYDGKIYAIKNNRFVRPQEKRRQIEMMERERSQQIRSINDRFSNSKNSRYDSHNSKGDNRKW